MARSSATMITAPNVIHIVQKPIADQLNELEKSIEPCCVHGLFLGRDESLHRDSQFLNARLAACVENFPHRLKLRVSVPAH